MNAAAMAQATPTHAEEVRRLIRRGVLVLLVGCAPIALWAALAPLASAVIAPAVVKVDLNRRPVQHAEGGIVREVRVRDGQQVAEGEPLIVLGDVSVDADMQRWASRVNAERASVARLEAEQAMAAAIAFPPDLTALAQTDAALAQLLVKERSLFDARRSALVNQMQLLRVQRDKIGQESQALQAQIAGAEEALRLQNEELKTNRGLQREGFISATRVTQLEAQVADYGVKLQERRSEWAKAEQKATDVDLRSKALESEYRQQASDQLKVTLARLAEIQQEQRKTGDAATRQVITAPASGEVMNLKVTAPGAVVSPRETIAEIVPAQQQLIVEAMVRPEDIDRVQVGRPAEVRLTAYARHTTKSARGSVSYVSADRVEDRQAKVAFYVAHIEVDPASLRDAGNLRMQAGMPAEVYIEGEQRTPLQYIVEPVTDLLHKAARER